ncbi:MAG: alpha/beta fold hydrolase [Luteitalea sp.]|nr:alpha/beta fold hydrolase [Luteitalea sp.]
MLASSTGEIVWLSQTANWYWTRAFRSPITVAMMAAALWLSILLPIARTGPLPGAPPQPSTSVPRFERSACPVDVVPDEAIDCGVLTVRENRRKADSRAIRLPVMIFRTRAAAPAPDPVLFVPGGPGVSAVAGRKSAQGNILLEDRDFIVLEPRGARHAQPALECPATNALKGEIAAGRLRGRAALARAAAECRANLTASGVDLDGYRTEALADDIEDLRKALGYDKWNLLGLSYGTRVVLTVLRRHPSGVRSVVLDSVLPPDVNFDEVATANLQRALNMVFDGCVIDRDCSAAYPDLRRRFADLIARADNDPLPLGLHAAGRPTEIRGAEVVSAIYVALHSRQMIPHIPRIISSAADGHYKELTPLVSNNQGGSSMAWGLRYSVWCADEASFERADRIAGQVSPDLGLGGIDEGTASPGECTAWNVAPAPAIENEPVKSDVPALIFAGEFDPDTPPDWGRQLLETMPNAVYVELRGGTHGAGFSSCGGEITMAFLRPPGSPLPIECALELRGADFGLSARPQR